jgi:hypothetical protein
VWLRILQHHPVGYLLEPLMRYRIGNNQFSARVRLGTEKPDFFLVIDHYLAQEQVQSMLNDNDVRNYRWLERRDRLMRAINSFIMDQPHQASILLHDTYSWDALAASFTTKRGFFVFILGVYLKFLTITGLYKVGKTSLMYLKRITSK